MKVRSGSAPERRVVRWAGLALALAFGTLLLSAMAPSWWRFGDATTVGAVATLGAVALLLLRHLVREMRATEQALARFSQRLRQGDVSGALRAVRAAGPSTAPDGELDSTPAESRAMPSRFGQFALEVERALGERERHWQARMRLSADWHWETDADLRFSWVSQDIALLVKLGAQPADLVGYRIDAVPLFQPPEGGWAAVTARLAERQPLRELMLEVRRAGRPPAWVALNARPYTDAQGDFAGYEGVGRDVTEQRLAYQRLAESERRHAMLAELSVDWYWQSDVEHRIEQFGPVAQQLYGQRALEALGKTRWELYPEGASAAEWAAHCADLDARRPFRGFEYALRGGGRGRRWIAVGGQPRFDAQGEFCGYHGVGRDITLRKSAERMLLDRNQALEQQVSKRTAELEQSNRDLEAFSRQLAHELRTPISQVAGLSDLLKSRAWERLTADEREWLRLQGQAAREMSQTVTTLLEMARSASIALVLEPVDLSALARAVVADLPWLERQAAVEWVIAPGLVAQCSAALARVMLINLLGNAAKFTRDVAAPRVEFGRDAAAGDACFFVQDNGAGFDAERAAALFQPFVRLHSSEQFQGTGLGLSIVRRIAERHGGHVSARGAPGCGARFIFCLGPPRDGQATAQDARAEAGTAAA